MKLLLIAPASGKWRHIGRRRVFNGRTFRFSLLSLLAVAAETPPEVEVRIVDEQIEVIPWAAEVDLVGITCMTALAPRAYEISARFRARGVPVVLGGMHPSLCSDEASQHADAIVVGEAEGIWTHVLRDAAAGRLQGRYRNPQPPSLAGLKRVPRDRLNRGAYATVSAVQATRGCPHACDFCSVTAFHQNTQRRRPVAEVVAEIATLPGRSFIFVDDNLVADPAYARALFAALAPLRKKWITQTTLSLADDTDLLRLAAKAGCVGVFVGLETFSAANLEDVHKTCHRVDHYREAIRRLHDHGVSVEAGIVFGFPADGVEVFRHTLATLDHLEVDVIQVSLFTPLPGTPRFASMADRLLDRNWTHYDLHHVVFEPWRMSAEALQAGHDWVTYAFYRPWRILRRLGRHVLRPRGWLGLPYLAAVNFAYYGRTWGWHIRGWDPAAELPAPPQGAGPRLTGLRELWAALTQTAALLRWPNAF